MRSFKSPAELELLVSEIQDASNESLAELALNVESGLSPQQRSSLVDVIVRSKDQVRAICVLDRDSDLTRAQTRALQAIAC